MPKGLLDGLHLLQAEVGCVPNDFHTVQGFHEFPKTLIACVLYFSDQPYSCSFVK